MTQVLAYTSPARGHLFPVTPVLEEIGRRGHGVAVRTLGSQVELMRDRGFEAAPIDPAIEAIEHNDYEARTPPGGLKRAVEVFCRRAEHDARDLEGAIDEVEPEVLLIDIHAWGARAVAERSGLPWASWCPHPLPLPSRDAPPYGPGLKPARGPLGRLRDALLNPLLFGSLDRSMRTGLNEVRERVGVAPLGDVSEMVSSIPLLLYMTAEPFEYPRSDWPDNVLLVGACDWDPPTEPPRWLDGIAEPVVLLTNT
jgi:UDP:flavonoid glycosyltransferase YjiC (YdhE family)